MIEGHTDGKGSDSYNLDLSVRRADSVKIWLTSHGRCGNNAVSTKGWGKARPIASNTLANGSDNPAGRAKNRRVEITLTP